MLVISEERKYQMFGTWRDLSYRILEGGTELRRTGAGSGRTNKVYALSHVTFSSYGQQGASTMSWTMEVFKDVMLSLETNTSEHLVGIPTRLMGVSRHSLFSKHSISTHEFLAKKEHFLCPV
jgi:hypothetical protein